jgi:hypothetical protein
MSIKFEASGDFSQLLAENQKYQQSLVKLTEQVQKLEANANKMAAAATKAGQQFAASGTPLGDYQRTVDKLSKQMAAGTISQTEFAQAVSKADAVYEKSKTSLDATTAKVEAHKGSLSGLGSQIATVAAGYLSWSAALGVVKEALQFVQQESDKAKESLKGLQPAEGQMAQIARNADDLAAMSGAADTLAAKYGVKREDTRAAIVEGRNLSIDDQSIESMVKYSDVASLGAQTTLGGKMSMIFGRDQVTPQEAASMGMLAAGASASNFEEMSKGIPSAAEGGRMAGASAEETLALYSVFAGQFPSAQVGAERIKALGGKIAKSDDLKGLGFGGAMEKMAGMKDEELFGGEGTVFGADMESRVAYETLKKEMAAFKAMRDKVGEEKATMRSGGDSFFETQYRQKFDPTLAKTQQGKDYVQTQIALEEQRKAEIAREIANERQFGTAGIQRQTGVDREMAALKDRQAVGAAQYAGQKAGDLATFVGGNETVAATATRAGAAAVGGDSTGFGGFAWNRLQGAATLGATDIIAAIRAAVGGDAQIEEQKTTRAAIERQTQVAEQTLEVLRRAPRSGASAAAAVPNVQRQGR